MAFPRKFVVMRAVCCEGNALSKISALTRNHAQILRKQNGRNLFFFFMLLKISWKFTSLELVDGVTPQSEALGLSSGTCSTVAAVIVSKRYIFTGLHIHVVRDWTLLYKWKCMQLQHALLQMLLGYALRNRWNNQLLTAQALGGPTIKNLPVLCERRVRDHASKTLPLKRR